jgi:Domain of unknown function (DUF6285)
MQTRPTPENLVATVRDYLADLQGRVDPVDQFQVRVSVHLLGIAERQLTRGAEVNGREQAALAGLVGEDGSLEELNRELCRQIRAGVLDDRWEAVLSALVDVVADEIGIVAPGKLG